MIFEFNPYETVEYTLTPNTVKIPVSVVSAFKSLPKLDGSQGSNYSFAFLNSPSSTISSISAASATPVTLASQVHATECASLDGVCFLFLVCVPTTSFVDWTHPSINMHMLSLSSSSSFSSHWHPK